MRIPADENIDRPIVRWLREQEHDMVEVAVEAPGASDLEVIEISRNSDRLLMKFDRDIGRLVLSQNKAHPGVVYLRLRGTASEVWERFQRLWPNVEPVAAGHLVTVRNSRIRRRPLPRQ